MKGNYDYITHITYFFVKSYRGRGGCRRCPLVPKHRPVFNIVHHSSHIGHATSDITSDYISKSKRNSAKCRSGQHNPRQQLYSISYIQHFIRYLCLPLTYRSHDLIPYPTCSQGDSCYGTVSILQYLRATSIISSNVL